MSNSESEDFAALLDEMGVESVPLEVGQRVRGEVIHVSRDSLFVALSPTQEAFILKAELVDEDGKLGVGVGDTIEAFVVGLKGGIELRKALGAGVVDIELLEEARKQKMPIEGTVTGVNKGGLEVAVGGTRGFCPMGQIDIDFVEDAQALVGQSFEFVVQEVKERGRNVVVSRRALLESRRKEKAKETIDSLEVGQRRTVTITRVASFGAFADLGGLDGLIPISQLAYGNVQKTEDVVAVGDQVEVEVVSIGDDEKKPGQLRIALSLKATLPDPFVAHGDDLHEGAELEGKVVRLQKFGAFVELFPGVQGLVHISEMSNQRIRHPGDVVSEGQSVRVRVLGTDPSERRIALSMKDSEEPPSDGAIAVGANVTGTVDRIERYGVFLKLESGHRALLPAAETGTPRGTDLSKEFPTGSELGVQIIAIDDQGRVKVSKTAREAAEEQNLVAAYNKSQSGGGGKGFGTLGDLLKAKAKK